MAVKSSAFKQAREEGRTLLTEVESKQVLKEAGISVVETRLATSLKEAQAIGKELGYPLVLKIASTDISHKSDVGGVKTGIKTATQLSKAYNDIMKAVKEKQPQARIQGVSVQNMAKPGVEVIAGMNKDPQFGPVLMFGLGGILVEILKDVSFRIVPITRRDAREMIREIKAYAVLDGARGQEPVDLTALEDLLLAVSGFVQENPEVKELDLNPVFAYKDGTVAVDARVVLEDKD